MVSFVCGAIFGGALAFMAMIFYEKYDYKKDMRQENKPVEVIEQKQEPEEENKEEQKDTKTPFDLVEDILNGEYSLDEDKGE